MRSTKDNVMLVTLRVFLIFVCVLHLVFGLYDIMKHAIQVGNDVARPPGVNTVGTIYSVLIGIYGIVAASKTNSFLIGIFAGGMLILMGFNAAITARFASHLRSPWQYAAYNIGTAISIFEALAFIASLFFANIVKDQAAYNNVA